MTGHGPTGPQERATGASPRPDRSMTLLTEMMERPLDPGYAEAAARRARGGAPAATALSVLGFGALAIALGFVGATASATLRAPQADVTSARTLLESEVTARTAEADAFRASRDSLATEVLTLQTEALAGTDEELLRYLERTDGSAGVVPVSGPGVRVTLADAADDHGADSWIQDGDIQVVINGLWSAGAEAIAINGHRLTSLAAVRGAGDAILVGLVALSGPYVIEAIGDPQHLEPDFARTAAYRYLTMLRTTHGLTAQVTGADELRLPAASGVAVRYATPTGPVPWERGAAQDPSTTTSATTEDDSP